MKLGTKRDKFEKDESKDLDYGAHRFLHWRLRVERCNCMIGAARRFAGVTLVLVQEICIVVVAMEKQNDLGSVGSRGSGS